jgi:hypothetical protein
MGTPDSSTSAFWESYFLDIKTPNIWYSHVPDADPEKWKRSVISQLRIILQSAAGTALLKSIKQARQWIEVVALPEDECNAHGLFTGLRVIDGRSYEGQLQFNPDVYMNGSRCYKRVHRPFKEPDHVLFHELIHAHRAASGQLAKHETLMAGLSGYSNEEEFLAVVLTNIYISETKGKGLRADYYSYDELKGALSTSVGFFASGPQALQILTDFSHDQEFLFDELAKVKAKFNPLAAMKEHPDQVEKASNSKASSQRDKTAANAAAAQLERIKKDQKGYKEDDDKAMATAVAYYYQHPRDLAVMLAQAALGFLPR